MSIYADTIAAAKRAAAERQTAEQVEEERRKAALGSGRAIAFEFLKSVVLPELEQARADLEQEGFSADIGNGQNEHYLRYSLSVPGKRVGQSTTLLFKATACESTGRGIPILLCGPMGSDGDSIPLEKSVVVDRIRSFILHAIR